VDSWILTIRSQYLFEDKKDRNIVLLFQKKAESKFLNLIDEAGDYGCCGGS
jgi:hypothetical protein